MLRRPVFAAAIPAVALCAQFIGHAAGAATVNYSETASGDLVYGGRGDVPVLFAFDVGVNTVTGTVAQSSPTSGNPPPVITDVDGFRFSLPLGLRLDSVTVTFSFRPTPNSEFEPGTCALFQMATVVPAAPLAVAKAIVNPAVLGDCNMPTIPDVASGGSPFAAVLPLTDGQFEVSNVIGTSLYGGGYFDYSYAFTVAAEVPLPGTLGLFGLAFAGVGAFARRSRRG